MVGTVFLQLSIGISGFFLKNVFLETRKVLISRSFVFLIFEANATIGFWLKNDTF